MTSLILPGPMVRAVLQGTKTQHRVPLKKQPDVCPTVGGWDGFWYPPGRANNCRHYGSESHFRKGVVLDFCPYPVGSKIWVKEDFSTHRVFSGSARNQKNVWYWADGNPALGDWDRPRSSAMMPRWASRLTLEVTSVRVERLQEISESEDDACQEMGFSSDGDNGTYQGDFEEYWEEKYENYPQLRWSRNPWVFVLGIRRVEG